MNIDSQSISNLVQIVGSQLFSNLVQTAQLIFVVFTLVIIIFQLRSYNKVEKARFQHEVVMAMIDGRNQAWRKAPDVFNASDEIYQNVSVARNEENFINVRALQDFLNNAFVLWKEHLLDKNTWITMEFQIKSTWKSQIVMELWIALRDKNVWDTRFVKHVEKLIKDFPGYKAPISSSDNWIQSLKKRIKHFLRY